MKLFKLLFFVILSFLLVKCKNKNSESESPNTFEVSSQEFYQLKIYSFFGEEQQQKTDKYLNKTYLPALKRLNINNIGVFKNRLNEKDSVIKTYVLTPFTNMNDFLNLESSLEKDSVYLNSGTDYINALHNERPYKRIESII